MRNNTRLWFLFHDQDLLLVQEPDGSFRIPEAAGPPLPPVGLVHDLGQYRGVPCSGCPVAAPPPGTGLVSLGLRASYDRIGPELYAFAGKAAQMIHWDRRSRFCSICGSPTLQDTPVSKQCPNCKELYFPPIATAVLALVQREDSILLVRARNFVGPHYGLVAGFLETGESLEQCVRREVLEETGIQVENVRYFGSQPWPYPSGLMAGFSADYKSGDLRLQEEELIHASFFTEKGLPQIPHKLSLARRMIDWWLDSRK